MKQTISTEKLITCFILFLLLLPIQKALGFELPVIYVMNIVWIYMFLFILIGKIKLTNFAQIIMIFFLLIIIELFLSTYLGTVSKLGRFYFPNDSIHYVARLLVFLFFFIKIYYKKISVDFFIKAFMVTLVAGMAIGLLQWIPWPGKTFLLTFYPFQDGSVQMSMADRDLSFVRIHGWAQFATANGGLAMFATIFGISNYLYRNNNKKLTVILIILGVLNIVISQARAGMLAFAFAIVLFYFIHMYVSRKRIQSSIKYFFMLGLAFIAIRIMYIRNNPFLERMIYRWEALFESSGGARVDQIGHAIDQINSPIDFLFGISRTVQSRSFNYFHIEVEPINIFVLNGLIGFLLQYGLVLILLIYFLKHMRKVVNNKSVLMLTVASFIMLSSYQVFSVGYFFFREARVGVIPWILIGVTVGAIEMQKKKREISEVENSESN